ncbi:MAG: histidine phosphatase family protein [Bacteroidia bacterium]
MKPKRIILIRHGESEGNVNKEVYAKKPDYALNLTANGEKQSLAAGKELKSILKRESVFFYVSPMWRTRQTFEKIVEALQPNAINYLEEPRIREQEWGHLRTKKESLAIEKDRDAYGVFYFRIPDGESAADVYDRVSDFFGTLHRDFEKDNYPDNVVIVAHGMSIRLFLMKWFHWTVEEFELLANPRNCEIIVLERGKDDKYILKNELKKYDKPDHNFQNPIKLKGRKW